LTKFQRKIVKGIRIAIETKPKQNPANEKLDEERNKNSKWN